MNINNGRQIRSLEDLEQIVNEWEGKFASSGKGFPPIWYRGHARTDWELEPRVLRKKFIQAVSTRGWPSEQIINDEFRRRSASFVERGTPLIDIYFLAQHHGLPTRLLDWTRNPLAALFFAVCKESDADGELIVLEPKCLISPQELFDPLINLDDDRITATMKFVFEKHPLPAKQVMKRFVLPILPDLRLARMIIQDSAFTLHMPDAEAINQIGDHICKFVVPKAVKSQLQIILRRMGVTWASLYCDVDHLAKEICVAWEIPDSC